MKPAASFLFRSGAVRAVCGAALCLWLAGAAVAQDRLVGQEYQAIEKLLASKDTATAGKAADAWLASHPRDPQMRLLKSRVLVAEGKKAEAKVMLLALTQDFPEIAEPFNNLAVMYAEEGQIGLAREALEAALRSNPVYATALENLGDIYRRMAYDNYASALRQQQGNKTLQGKMQALER